MLLWRCDGHCYRQQGSTKTASLLAWCLLVKYEGVFKVGLKEARCASFLTLLFFSVYCLAFYHMNCLTSMKNNFRISMRSFGITNEQISHRIIEL